MSLLDRSELLARLDVAAPRYTSYPTVPHWTTTFGAREHAGTLDEAGRRHAAEPLSLYVHVPFCRELCAYCGCNVVVTRNARKPDPYLDRVAREMDLVARRLGDRRSLGEVHWGGGTPTFLCEAQLERLWSEIGRRFAVRPGAEIAIEIDPVETSKEKLALLRGLGFRRLSMGVQDLDGDVQRAVRRIQTSEETEAMLETARALGFASVNFDLICGLPLQTPASWRRTIERVAAMRPDRIAIYSFAFVPSARPNQRALDGYPMPTGRNKLALRMLAEEILATAGYLAIGMDHFALPGDDLARAAAERRLRRNFQGYTTQPRGDTVAIGVTGISDVQGAYAQNVRPLRAYYAAIDRGELATERGIRLTDDDRRRRAVIESLMCNFAVDLGPGGATAFESELEELRGFEREGLVVIDGDEVTVTLAGRPFVRNVAMCFDAHARAPGSAAVFSRAI